MWGTLCTHIEHAAPAQSARSSHSQPNARAPAPRPPLHVAQCRRIGTNTSICLHTPRPCGARARPARSPRGASGAGCGPEPEAPASGPGRGRRAWRAARRPSPLFVGRGEAESCERTTHNFAVARLLTLVARACMHTKESCQPTKSARTHQRRRRRRRRPNEMATAANAITTARHNALNASAITTNQTITLPPKTILGRPQRAKHLPVGLPRADAHARCRAWLEKAFSSDEPVCLAWVTVLAFLRIRTLWHT